MIYSFKGKKPKVHPSSFVHPLASVTGDVVIGKNVFIGSGAALRGDFGRIIVGDGCNVQENCIIHMFPGTTVRLGKGAHIGHGAIVHGAQIGKNVLIGMHAVIMDHAVIGDDSIIGAMTFVPEEMKIGKRELAVGNPARVIKKVSAKMLKWKKEGTKIYQGLPAEYLLSMKENPAQAVRPEKSRRKIGKGYKTWKRTRK